MKKYVIHDKGRDNDYLQVSISNSKERYTHYMYWIDKYNDHFYEPIRIFNIKEEALKILENCYKSLKYALSVVVYARDIIIVLEEIR